MTEELQVPEEEPGSRRGVGWWDRVQGRRARFGLALGMIILWVVAFVGLALTVAGSLPASPFIVVFGAAGIAAAVGSMVAGFWHTTKIARTEYEQRPGSGQA